MKRMAAILGLLVVGSPALPARAETPGRVHLEGYLATTEGEPVSASVAV